MKRENTKQKIIETALTLFSERGYDAVSVGEIAEAVGIKRRRFTITTQANKRFSTRSSKPRLCNTKKIRAE